VFVLVGIHSTTYDMLCYESVISDFLT